MKASKLVALLLIALSTLSYSSFGSAKGVLDGCAIEVAEIAHPGMRRVKQIVDYFTTEMPIFKSKQFLSAMLASGLNKPSDFKILTRTEQDQKIRDIWSWLNKPLVETSLEEDLRGYLRKKVKSHAISQGDLDVVQYQNNNTVFVRLPGQEWLEKVSDAFPSQFSVDTEVIEATRLVIQHEADFYDAMLSVIAPPSHKTTAGSIVGGAVAGILAAHFILPNYLILEAGVLLPTFYRGLVYWKNSKLREVFKTAKFFSDPLVFPRVSDSDRLSREQLEFDMKAYKFLDEKVDLSEPDSVKIYGSELEHGVLYLSQQTSNSLEEIKYGSVAREFKRSLEVLKNRVPDKSITNLYGLTATKASPITYQEVHARIGNALRDYHGQTKNSLRVVRELEAVDKILDQLLQNHVKYLESWQAKTLEDQQEITVRKEELRQFIDTLNTIRSLIASQRNYIVLMNKASSSLINSLSNNLVSSRNTPITDQDKKTLSYLIGSLE